MRIIGEYGATLPRRSLKRLGEEKRNLGVGLSFQRFGARPINLATPGKEYPELKFYDGMNLKYKEYDKLHRGGILVEHALIENSTFVQAHFKGQNFITNSIFKGVNFAKAFMRLFCFEGSQFQEGEGNTLCSFAQADLGKVSFKNAHFSKVTDFVGASLIDTDFTGSNLLEVNKGNFEKALYSPLTKFPLGFTPPPSMILIKPGANLKGLDLEYVQARYTNFENINFSQAKMKRADLKNATFTKCNFEKAILSRAYLKESQMSNCDFTDAKLKQLNLENAIIQDSTFERADLRGANLKGLKILGKCNFSGALYDQYTILDDAMKPYLKSMTLVQSDSSVYGL